MNLNSPSGSDGVDPTRYGNGPAGPCAGGDFRCASFNYGYRSAQWAIQLAKLTGHSAPIWWLDVETLNTWSPDAVANDDVITGAIQAVHEAGAQAAAYSTSLQWSQIAGANYHPGIPVWYPTGKATGTPRAWCTSSSFDGGPVYMVQVVAGAFDGDYTC